MLLDLTDAPTSPVDRIRWLDQVTTSIHTQIEDALAETYFEARTQGTFEAALAAGVTSRKRALAWTRARNEQQGRSIRWSDGADPTSTAYRD